MPEIASGATGLVTAIIIVVAFILIVVAAAAAIRSLVVRL